MAHFAALVQRQEGFRDLIRIHQRIGSVDQQQVDTIGGQVNQ